MMFFKSKMNKLFVFVSLTFIVLNARAADSSSSSLPSSSASQPAMVLPSSSSKLSIGVLNVQAAIIQTDEGKIAKANIEKEVDKRKKEILRQQDELKKLQENFDAQQSVLSDDEKLSKQKEFQTKYQKFQAAQMGFQEETRQKELAATGKIYKKLIKIVQDISKQKGFDMVFDSSAGVLVYAANVNDITADAVSQYNSMFPVSSSPKGSEK